MFLALLDTFLEQSQEEFDAWCGVHLAALRHGAVLIFAGFIAAFLCQHHTLREG